LNNKSKSAITVKLVNITGGDVGHGLAMFSAIKNSRSKVIIECYGSVASFGTILLQAASPGGRHISQFSEFLIHYGSTQIEQDLLSSESAAQANKAWRSTMIHIYAEQCINGSFFKERKYSISKVKTYLNTKLKNYGDWYVSPEDAVEYGFADKII
jgi:ATP-dependent protease ClpP protease subunit